MEIALADTTGSLTGVIESGGGGTITQLGHVYSPDSKTPTVADSKTELGISFNTFPASFTSHLTGLKPATTYYVRAYATNSAGTGYGSVLTVTTADKKILVPNWDGVTSLDSITARSFRIKNTLTGNGGGAILQHGHVYSAITPLPTLADSKTEQGPLTGPFPKTVSSRIADLKDNTAYYVRAYASNSAGVSYGPVFRQTTLEIKLPVVANLEDRLGATETQLNVSARITELGNETLLGFGFAYTDGARLPTTDDPSLKLGQASLSPLLNFTGTLKNLKPNTNYT
ncbi:hypothetical protein LC612_43300, partial [Nostoc sp. CHAB 5834]|nr:hypothetical protein [Nostoc sp. CHAB 5834]